MGSKERENELKIQAEGLAEVVSSLFDKKGSVKLGKPALEMKTIIEWNNRMRITGMEKFNAATYISYMSCFLNDQEKQKKNVLGALILYIVEPQLFPYVTKLQYPKIDDENEDELLNSCGLILADIAKAFAEKLTGMGYSSLTIDSPQNYKNSIAQGVPFSLKEYDKFEIMFSSPVDSKKVMALEMTLGVIPKR